MALSPSQPNKSLIDGIAVLQAVAESGEPVSCLNLAQELGMEPTRVNRLLKTLEYLDVIRQNRSRRYLAGSGMHVLSALSLFGSGILQRAVPYLENLALETGLVVALGVYWRGKVIYLYHCRKKAGSVVTLGRQSPYDAGASSIGMALLAACGEARLRSEFGDGVAPGFHGDGAEFAAELTEIRRQGYAMLRMPHYNVAMTLPDESGAAVALSDYFDGEQTPYYVGLLRDTVERIADNCRNKQL